MRENEQSRDGLCKGRRTIHPLTVLMLSLQALALITVSKSHGSKTTVLRAAAFKSDVRVSSMVALSYIFLDQVLRQPNNPPGFPIGPRAWNGQPAAYGMDPRIVDDPRYSGRMAKAFESLAILSIICPNGDLFNARTGLYVNSQETGEPWERPCSVELLPPDGREGFRIDCGLQIQGGQSRVPSKSPKHSFRLLFKAMRLRTKSARIKRQGLESPDRRKPSSFTSLNVAQLRMAVTVHRFLVQFSQNKLATVDYLIAKRLHVVAKTCRGLRGVFALRSGSARNLVRQPFLH